MSEQIDWSKAPEGATHYNPQCGDWYMVDSDCVSYWSYSHSNWLESSHWNARKVFCIARPTTPSWSGSGLPPVGVVCEVKLQEEWSLCEIIAHFQQPQAMVAAFTVAQFHGGKKLDSKIAECFRPIRTPEQIASDEREAAIKRACEDIEKRMEGFNVQLSYSLAIRAAIEAMIDKGYRKP